MPKKGYNFNNIESVLTRINTADPYPTSGMMSDLKKELNNFFTEAKCVDVIFTKNTDKLFFGMCVMPVINDEEVLDIVLSDKKVTIKKYYLEIDSKLLQMGLSTKELAAVLLHEIGHMVIDDQPIEIVRANIDKYCADNAESISIKGSAKHTKLIGFAIKDSLNKCTSMMFKDNDEMVADAFVVACGYGDYLANAQTIICGNSLSLINGVKGNKLYLLSWALRLYTNMKFGRVAAINTLKKSKSYTGSELTKREVDNVIRALNKTESESVKEATYLLNEFGKKDGFFTQMKMKGLKGIEDDYYEFKVRIKNANTESEALYTLRQINSRIAMLEDYIYDNNLSPHEEERWVDLLNRYKTLRSEIAAKKVYNKRQYGIWFDYTQLDDKDKI